MYYNKGIYFCTESNYDGKFYESKHVVTIPQYYGRNEQHNTTDLDDDNGRIIHCHDFKTLTGEKKIFSEEDHEFAIDKMLPPMRDVLSKRMEGEELQEYLDNYLHKLSHVKSIFLKPEVIEWLNENVAPSTDAARADQPQGWACGNDVYCSHATHDIAIWFLRRADAMKFIKTFSQHKKPLMTYNQDTYKKCILTNGKLVEQKRT